ncbi:hypothetical protein BD289DRAFT_461178 [Coniella lustricola]|uniref:RRM domain-containing protein n=1 Tax=Coniella lustricola TaxID=2025994 RepID=A0A2T3A6N8_9PEZI|nr:hypothetical protein BD289DRAFT_461178 [Coniella lustricola]
MADEEFEIDVYGDADNGHEQDQGAEDYNHHENGTHSMDDDAQEETVKADYDNAAGPAGDAGYDSHVDDQSAAAHPQQGVKRKQELDERPVDTGATNALLISEMQWWNTEDEIRGWVNYAGCEDELREITFSEHKVNGKSKGQAYVEFQSPQAATAVKRYMDNSQSGDGTSNQQRRATAAFHNANNPFKTLPKDAPQRQSREVQGRGAPASGNYSNGPPASTYQGSAPSGGYQGSYRGSRGGYRGGMRGGFGQGYGNNMNTYNNNNNNMGGFNGMGGAYGRGGMGNAFGRGAPNMRGRGGMNNMMGAVPMMGGNMGMPGMMPGMNMMGGGMPGMGFNPMSGGQFNPSFFGANQNAGNFGANNQGNSDWGNPHGAKRARGE